MKAIKPLLFTPSTYRLDFSIEYSIDDQPNQDVIEAQVNVRAPLWAIIAGSLAGAVAGRALHAVLNRPDQVFGQPWDQPRLLTALARVVAHMLLAAIVVVAFARKKDTQPVLSVEDFYGGIFIGVLVGYNGVSYFSNVLGSTSSPSKAS